MTRETTGLGSELLRRCASRAALLTLLTGCLVQSACVSSAPDKRVVQILNEQGFGRRYTGNAEEEDYLTIGDSVTYADTFNVDVGGTERVAIDGTIVLPEVGAVHVAGLTRVEVEALLTQKFSPYYQRNDISVRLGSTSPKYYYVLGEVPQPGPRPFMGNKTIFEVVTEVSPNPQSANTNRIKVIRADPREPLVITIPYGEMVRTGDSTYNVLIQENDIIVIPPTMLAQVGYFISDLIYPVTTVTQTIFSSFFAFNALTNYGTAGFGGFGGGKNKGGGFNIF